jgi:lipoate-protein ligase A
MILWEDDARGAIENMRRDAALLDRLDAGGAQEPVLRIYGFSPPGITLGLSQDPARALDLAACARDGIEWAVRPTGGRAVFHDEEWTYALAARIDDPLWGGTLNGAYGRASALIARALQAVGIPAELASGSRREAPDPKGAGGPVPCFASTARHEIVLGARKLVGSAQRRTSRALLQQGSILLGPAHRRLGEYLPRGPGRDRAVRLLETGAAEAGPEYDSVDRAAFLAALAGIIGAAAARVDAREGLLLLTGARRAPYAADQRSQRASPDIPNEEMRS